MSRSLIFARYAMASSIELNFVCAVSPRDVRTMGLVPGPAVIIPPISITNPRLPMVLESIL